MTVDDRFVASDRPALPQEFGLFSTSPREDWCFVTKQLFFCFLNENIVPFGLNREPLHLIKWFKPHESPLSVKLNGNELECEVVLLLLSLMY